MTDNVRRDSASDDYRTCERRLLEALDAPPMPDAERLENLYMYLTPQHMRRMFFWYEVYQRILTVPGVIMQLGVRWGRDLALLEALRTTFEPFNHSRRLVGFDTFEGFSAIDDKDGEMPMAVEGNLATREGYASDLDAFLRNREALSPLPHVKKFELVVGDASETLETYLGDHPETVVSLVHFDMDIYRPTKRCMEIIKPYLTKGSIVILDELNCGEFPGETVALREVFGTSGIRLERHPHVNPTWPGFFVIE